MSKYKVMPESIADYFNDETIESSKQKANGLTNATPKQRTQQVTHAITQQTSDVVDKLQELSSVEIYTKGVTKARRSTVRDSFDIYYDQQQWMHEHQQRFLKKTGVKLSKSRIIRDALAMYQKATEV